MSIKNLFATALILTASQSNAMSHYTFIGSGSSEGSYAYFTVTGTQFVGPNYAGLFIKDGAGYAPGIGNYSITYAQINTDRYGMIHPSTGISTGFTLNGPTGGVGFFLQPSTLGGYGSYGSDFGAFGTYNTYSSYILIPNPPAPIGTYSVDIASLNGTLTISDGTVPEPDVWMTMLVGFAIVGWTMRRRRSLLAV